MKILFALSLILGISVAAHATVPHQTVYFKGVPTDAQIAKWSAEKTRRSYLLEMGNPSSDEVAKLANLREVDGPLQVEINRYPLPGELPGWKTLAAKRPVTMVSIETGIPNDYEIDCLNEIRLSRLLIVMNSYPGTVESERLARVKAPVSITFAVSAYPKFEDQLGLQALPQNIPLLFVIDYWPFWEHKEVMNALPNVKRLRVMKMFPPEDEIKYLLQIQNLDEVAVQTDFDPATEAWQAFKDLKSPLGIRWISAGRVPTEGALKTFERSARPDSPRKLTIDSDWSFSPNEEAMLNSSPLPVEWLHAID